MQKIKNTSDSAIHLPGKYGGVPASEKKNRPTKSVLVAPDQSVDYDLDGLIEDRPKLAHLRKHFDVARSGAPAPAPVPAVRAPDPVEEVATPAPRGVPAWAVGRTDEYVLITTDEARELITNEIDVTVLKAWRSVETRKGVQSLLDERFKSLTPEA